MSALLEEAFEPPIPGPSQPAAPRAPFASFQLRRSIANIETELLVQSFDDRVLVIVTQNDKIGCMTQATLPAVASLQPPPAHTDEPSPLSALPPPPTATALTPLLGSPPNAILHDLYVSQIATLVWWAQQLAHAPRRPVIVGLSLGRVSDEDQVAETERERFGGIMDMVASWPGPGE